jgi:uncharacterized membrane protein HdeD (DUF308 family)
MNARQVHHFWTYVFSAALVVIGCALLVQGISQAAVPRILLGVLFAAAGCLRAYVEMRRKHSA